MSQAGAARDRRNAEDGLSDGDFAKIARLVYESTGIVLDDTRRALVVGRLGKRLRARGLRSFSEYIRVLGQDKSPDGELRQLINAITTNKTSFFREAHHFVHLKKLIQERMQRARTKPSLQRLRIWSAGCSTGEEPYTIALTVSEALGTALRDWDVRILATDIDTDVLSYAERGVYAGTHIQGIPAQARVAFDDAKVDGQRALAVRESLRDLVSFRQLNLIEPSWPIRGPFDVIFCRNVTIYFDRPTQERLYRHFASLLSDDGTFVAGHSENLGWLSDIFALGDCTTVYVPARRASASGPAAPDNARSFVDTRTNVADSAEASSAVPSGRRPWGTMPEAAIMAGGVMSSETPMLLKTTLGSCVAVCLYDPVARIGGMNHFMLPRGSGGADMPTRFGVHAMEMLINQLLKLGADRQRLVAKIAGACSVVPIKSAVSVAEKNLRFAEDFLALEGFPITSRRVGGERAMELRFRTDTGEAFVRVVDPTLTSQVAEQDARYSREIAAPVPVANDPDEGITWFR